MLYDIIMKYLTSDKKVDRGSYSREEILQGLNRAFGPIFMPGMTEAYLNKVCPEGETLTDSELEKVLDKVNALAKDVWQERFVHMTFKKQVKED